ncbi:MAG: penicillin-binding transpeptidase domain-containing protein, partial [Deltaproteobacteria bacterium]|nr:penicillin-binding transpeptidase domain-containing protein [Deltaproteobacteria bacterium]
GEKTGIEIPYEEGGLIPSSEWKMRRFKQKWIESETLSIAIGQGYDLVSPLQNARMIAMVANGGRKITPHLLKEILGPDRKTVRIQGSTVGEKVIPDEVLKPVQEGLIAVVHGEGTARRLRASPNKIAGKTGTAQGVGYGSKLRGERVRDHALFVSYAPYDDPKIAVSVIVENGGHGGSDAAPVAQAVIDAYLGKKEGSDVR